MRPRPYGSRSRSRPEQRFDVMRLESAMRRFQGCAGVGLVGLVIGCAIRTGPQELDSVEAQPAVEPAVVIPTRTDACADPALEVAARWVEATRLDQPGELSRYPLPDVDGDGLEEAMYLDEHQCGVTGNCPRVLMLSDGGECLRYAGGFWATAESEEVLPTRHHGVADLRVYVKGGCAGLEGSVERLEFDGTAYRVAESVQCACFETANAPPDRDPLCPG
jgi:hypothetical protein